MARKMGVDFGKVRIGIALSDPMAIIASPHQTYVRVSFEKDLNFLKSLIQEKSVDTVVFGLPLQMDGEEGQMAKDTRFFAEKLKNIVDINIVFEDERLTSVEAEEFLIKANVRREKRKMLIDKIAAQIILEQYLERRN